MVSRRCGAASGRPTGTGRALTNGKLSAARSAAGCSRFPPRSSPASGARDTATNPAVLDAFALAILGSNGPAAYTGLPGAAPDFRAAERDAAAIRSSVAALRSLVPGRGGSYVSESDFFEEGWQRSFWGDHYPRLHAVKMKYDPTGFFFVHHGVGSEYWSPDGFTPVHNT